MKYDEFSFFNQQLAGMLKTGIPLEGSLKELTRSMRRGRVRRELEALRADLESGAPLPTALQKRKLPPLYIATLSAGAQTGSLPEILVLLADYYGRLQGITTRLKGLMVYPALILAGCFGLSTLLAVIFSGFFGEATEGFFPSSYRPATTALAVWMPPLAFLAALLVVLGAIANSRLRAWLRWHFPGAKEASLAQSASAISILLSSGTSLDEALLLIQAMEKRTAAAADISRWREALREGRSRFSDMAVTNRIFPPLFVWLVSQGGEDLAAGFKRAAEIYSERATNRADMLLYAALPLTVAVLGFCVLGQLVSVGGVITRMINSF